MIVIIINKHSFNWQIILIFTENRKKNADSNTFKMAVNNM